MPRSNHLLNVMEEKDDQLQDVLGIYNIYIFIILLYL